MDLLGWELEILSHPKRNSSKNAGTGKQGFATSKYVSLAEDHFRLIVFKKQKALEEHFTSLLTA